MRNCTAGTLDDDRTRTYVAPRRRRSGWARSNERRVVALEREGLTTDAGRRVIAAAQADGS